MFRVTKQESATGAKAYFRDEYSRADYYTGSEVVSGQWFGRAAELLGLEEEVDRDQFARLADNLHPLTGERLTARTKANRRVGFDCSFSCPKSVTLLYSLGGDENILTAFQESVAFAMKQVELAAATRVRLNGANTDRRTENLVWAEFIHTTTRPVGGVPDPQLHAHCFVFNCTHDAPEGRWKAVQPELFKKFAWYFEGLYLSDLAARMERLGYPVVAKGSFWEVAGCPESLIDKFSNRTREIREEAVRRGVEDPDELDGLGARTRKGKSGALAGAQLKKEWRSRLTAKERLWMLECRSGRTDPPDEVEVSSAVRASLGRLFERASVLEEKVVVNDVLRTSPGRYFADEVREALKVNGVVRREVGDEVLVTTAEALKEEKRIVELAVKGRGQYRNFGGHFTGGNELSAEQTIAGAQILRSQDFITILEGRAGAGKTTLIKAVTERMQEAGYKPPVMLAPTSRAARTVLREEGHKNADTVARFLVDPEMQKAARKGVIWMDEATLCGSSQLLALLERAHELDARVVLSGDSRQNRSVARGSPFKAIQDYAGVEPARVETIQRQKGDLRDAVQQFADGDPLAGLQKLKDIGAIHEVPDFEVYERAGKAYADEVASRDGKKGRRMPAMLVVPTHREIDEATSEVRKQLKERKILGRSKTFTSLVPVEGTLADRSDTSFYERGQVVHFHQNASKGFKAGTKWRVTGRSMLGDHVEVRHGTTFETLPLNQADRFGVYEEKEIELAVGDSIRITRNGRTKSVRETAGDNIFGNRRATPNRDLLNGSVHRIKRFTRNGGLHLDNGLYVPKDYGHFTHGYALTSHAAQGMTCDHVIYVATQASGEALGPRQLMVGVSRGSQRFSVFTDSMATLKQAAARSDPDRSALEVDPDFKVVRPKGMNGFDQARGPGRGREQSGPSMEM